MQGSCNARPGVSGEDHAICSKEGCQLQSPTTSIFSYSNRERLNDPFVSMLDLDDDSRLSVASDIYDDGQSNDVSLDDSSHRLSYLGPNLRFHSRAPWETDDTTLDNDQELGSGFFGSSKKALGFSSSPRTGNARRPSGESTRSHAKSKQSFETTSSQLSYPRGALYALAQESFSTSSLRISAAAEKPVRSKTPLNSVRPDSTHNTTTLLPSSTFATHSNHTPLTNLSQHEAQDAQSTISHNHLTYADDFHPYANPDLAFQVLEEHHYLSPGQGILHNDTIGTDSMAHSGLSRSETRSTLAPVNPPLSVGAQNCASAIQGREISPPISAVNTRHLDSKLPSNEESFSRNTQPVAETLSGWTDVIHTGFSLISLEEARARKQSTTSQPTVALSPPSSSIPSSFMLHPESHNVDSRRYDIEDGDFSPRSQRARARSASAGAKAKVAFQSIAVGGQPRFEADVGRGKTLKPRKSGFMRLFNGGRGQDKEEPPPPVPSLSDAYVALDTAQQIPKAYHNFTPDPSLSDAYVALGTAQQTPKAYHNFTPDPSLSLEASLSSPEQTPSPADVPALVKLSPNLKRPIPPLSINTQPQRTLPAAENEDLQMHTAPFTRGPQPPWSDNVLPQSAPANVSDFPALKLRPVSTAFSAQFVDHIVLPDCRPSLETDGGTPISSTRVFSPVTPGSASLFDLSSTDPKLTAPTNTTLEDNSSVIGALQERILHAKLAWQRQIWELESQVRDLKAEVDDLQKAESEGTFCERCGRGKRRPNVGSTQKFSGGEAQNTKNLGVMSRPRARTGSSSRFGSALP